MMRHRITWLGVMAGICGVLVATGLRATPSYGGFTGTTMLTSTFEGPINLKHKAKGVGDDGWEWEAELETEGQTQLFIQENTWPAGASTGWHSHPGFSLVTVTAGEVWVYDGEEPTCQPQRYGVGATFIDAASNNHPHLIRNEGAAEAKTTAVQLIPEAMKNRRRLDAPRPAQCGVDVE